MQRRRFLVLATTGMPAAAMPIAAFAAANEQLFNVGKLKTHVVSRFEVVYKTPRGNPNGLALTQDPNEIWVINQAAESRASLIRVSDGSLIREFETDTRGDSGICVDDDNVMWITSTGNRLIVSCSPEDGKTLAKYVAPGAGRIYEQLGDPPARNTTLEFAYPRPPHSSGPIVGLQNVGATAGQIHPSDGKLPPGQVPLDMENPPAGSGSHGILSRANLLYVASPPSRTVFVIDKRTWVVQSRFPVPGNRPHDLTWASEARTHFWKADSNLNAFFLYDALTGQITERIQIADNSPVVHGAKLILRGVGAGHMYCCDDHGWMWRFRMPV